MAKRKQYRQGDVFLIPCAKPKNFDEKKVWKIKKDRTVALGEHTGHHHIMTEDATVFVNEKGEMIVRAEDGTKIQHLDAAGTLADHAPIEVDPGLYKVKIQQEYRPNKQWQSVVD